MKHLGTIASREIRSLFVSPVAYVVLTLWAVLAGFFFLSNLIAFHTELVRMQQLGAFEMVRNVNLNDHLITPFMGSMWIILIFAVPGIAREFIESQRHHVQMEEAHFLPHAEAKLSDEDLAELDTALFERHDPLFGSRVEQKYATLRDNILKWEQADEAS